VASEQIVTKEDVRLAEAVYVGNSVRGLVQVEVVDSECFHV
jgi:branched-subunit amino acid aminotransferase/4-amino-4-deoxychorismate lyase